MTREPVDRRWRGPPERADRQVRAMPSSSELSRKDKVDVRYCKDFQREFPSLPAYYTGTVRKCNERRVVIDFGVEHGEMRFKIVPTGSVCLLDGQPFDTRPIPGPVLSRRTFSLRTYCTPGAGTKTPTAGSWQ